MCMCEKIIPRIHHACVQKDRVNLQADNQQGREIQQILHLHLTYIIHIYNYSDLVCIFICISCVLRLTNVQISVYLHDSTSPSSVALYLT